jgi:hypothetical protein
VTYCGATRRNLMVGQSALAEQDICSAQMS